MSKRNAMWVVSVCAVSALALLLSACDSSDEGSGSEGTGTAKQGAGEEGAGEEGAGGGGNGSGVGEQQGAQEEQAEGGGEPSEAEAGGEEIDVPERAEAEEGGEGDPGTGEPVGPEIDVPDTEEEIAALLYGRWEGVAMADSGHPRRPVPEGFFWSFSEAGVSMDCDGKPVAFEIDASVPALHVSMSPESPITWYLVTLTEEEFVFGEGGDLFYFERRDPCP